MAAAATYGSIPSLLATEVTPIVYSGTHMQVVIPKERLLPGSLWIESKQASMQVSEEAHLETYDLIQKIGAIWRKEKGVTHFFVIAKGETERSSSPFRIEIIPFPDAQFAILNKIAFLERGFRLFMRATFGGYPVSLSEKQNDYAFYDARSSVFSEPLSKEVGKVEKVQKDFFCNPAQRGKQLVFEGRNVNIYYDYAPLGVPLQQGEPPVHFLIAPKVHRENFTHLTKEEYLETSLYASALQEYYTKKDAECYHIHRTGRLLQSVWHHHQHFHANPTGRDFGVKMTVFAKMLLGGRALPPLELQTRVQKFQGEIRVLLAPVLERAMQFEQSQEEPAIHSHL